MQTNDGRYPKTIVVGDNSHLARSSRTCTVQRKTLAQMQPGDEIVVSFTDEFGDRTPRRVYRCKRVWFADTVDERTGRASVLLEIADERGLAAGKKKGGAK